MLDQFGDQLGNLYTGATVLEDIEGLRVDIPTNQALAGSGTYIDPVGFFNHNGIHVPADSPQIATWEADPNPALPIPNDPTQTQNIGVKVDTFVLSPAIVNRQVTPAPPAISYGDVALINLKQRGSAMRPVKNVVIGLLLIVVVGLLAPIAAGSQSAPNGKTKGEAQDRDSEEIPGGVFLQELGEKNNCYFTLEEIWRDGHVEDLLGSVWVKRGDKNRPLADVLQSMQRKRPNFSFEPDPKNPQIIHIIDLRLGKLRNYSLDQVLDRFDFSGTTPELNIFPCKARRNHTGKRWDAAGVCE